MVQQILAVEYQLIRRDIGGPRQKTHQGQHRNRFARAGFADDRHDLSGIQVKRDTVHRGKQAAGGLES
jgi:hypothetical protein